MFAHEANSIQCMLHFLLFTNLSEQKNVSKEDIKTTIMFGKKKLSGAQNLKRKQEKDVSLSKYKGSLEKYLKT